MANEVISELKKGASSFKLVGKMVITPNTFKMESKSGTGFISNKMYVGVNCGKGNTVYAQMFGGYAESGTSKVYLHGKQADPNNPRRDTDDYSNQFEIGWDDRFNVDVLNNCGPSCFIQVALEKDTSGNLQTQKFLSEYDAIRYIKDVTDRMSAEDKDKLVVDIRGNLEYRYYEGKVSYQKTITSVKLADVTEDKYTASFTQAIYVDKDGIGKADMERKVLPLNVKIAEYVSKYKNTEIKETVLLEVEMELDANAKIAPWLANNIKKSSGYAKAVILGSFVESGSTESFDITSLPADVQKYIADGVLSEEDVMRTVASGNQRQQILTINAIKTAIDENKNISPSFEASAYTSKEIDDVYNAFMSKVKAIDKGEKPVTTTVETPTDNADEVPFDLGENTDNNLDGMDWMKNFQ
jgi:hypothetical protein